MLFFTFLLIYNFLQLQPRLFWHANMLFSVVIFVLFLCVILVGVCRCGILSFRVSIWFCLSFISLWLFSLLHMMWDNLVFHFVYSYHQNARTYRVTQCILLRACWHCFAVSPCRIVELLLLWYVCMYVCVQMRLQTNAKILCFNHLHLIYLCLFGRCGACFHFCYYL